MLISSLCKLFYLFPFLCFQYIVYANFILQVSPKEIPSPKNLGIPLNAYMLHNLAHVELNAIDLAWDTVVRFSPYLDVLGHGFFIDFAHVADDESRHFTWCLQRLSELGFRFNRFHFVFLRAFEEGQLYDALSHQHFLYKQLW